MIPLSALSISLDTTFKWGFKPNFLQKQGSYSLKTTSSGEALRTLPHYCTSEEIKLHKVKYTHIDLWALSWKAISCNFL